MSSSERRKNRAFSIPKQNPSPSPLPCSQAAKVQMLAVTSHTMVACTIPHQHVAAQGLGWEPHIPTGFYGSVFPSCVLTTTPTSPTFTEI